MKEWFRLREQKANWNERRIEKWHRTTQDNKGKVLPGGILQIDRMLIAKAVQSYHFFTWANSATRQHQFTAL